MSDVEQQYYFCLKHNTVESGDSLCKSADRLGPYPDRATAERALDTVQQRNESWDAEDRRFDDD
ncbi:MAG TPA: hypothetical protein VGD72_00425 [Mycobacteriales bacterium]|jgi:hypothetical protein